MTKPISVGRTSNFIYIHYLACFNSLKIYWSKYGLILQKRTDNLCNNLEKLFKLSRTKNHAFERNFEKSRIVLEISQLSYC